jgi:hypothetical protein
MTDGSHDPALGSTRINPRTAVHHGCSRLSSKTAWTMAPAFVPQTTTQGPCQRFARNCATRNLTLPHDPTLGSAFHLRGCVVT